MRTGTNPKALPVAANTNNPPMQNSHIFYHAEKNVRRFLELYRNSDTKHLPMKVRGAYAFAYVWGF